MRRLMIFVLFVLALVLLFPVVATGQGTITTVAGNGDFGYTSDGVQATSTRLAYPTGVAVDPAGNLFIADFINHRIRKVAASTGLISTVAGTGLPGFSGDNGPATSAKLNYPAGIAIDSAGNLFIAEQNNNRIRKVDANGTITTVAGAGFSGSINDNIPATSARLYSPFAVAVDPAGNLFISDTESYRIRKVDAVSGIITTVAGRWAPPGFSGDNGLAIYATLNYPAGVALDSAGNIFIADDINRRIRRVDASTGVITTVAGTGDAGYNGDNIAATTAWLKYPMGVAVDSAGSLFIADSQNYRVRKVDGSTGIITTVAGTGDRGYNGDNIAATSAQLSALYGLAVTPSGAIFIADGENNRIRRVVFNSPPAAEAGPNQTVEATASSGASVALDGSASSDPDNDPLGFEWRDSGNNLVGSAAVLTLTVPLGSHVFTLTVNDGKGGTASDSVAITVQDTTPPAISGMPSNMTLEATGPSGAIATWTAPTASDLVDGVRPVTCSPVSGATFALGTTLVTCSAADTRGSTTSDSFQVLVRDTTPPLLVLPPLDPTYQKLVADAIGPAGAMVNFSVTATDIVDPDPVVSCQPLSGSLFAIGTSTVNCTATDARGNIASGSFQVLVKAAAEQVADLVILVDSFNLQQGIESSLDKKLTNAMIALNEANVGNRANVCNVLGAFINETQAQAGKALTEAQAAGLIGDAARIRAVLACP